MDDKVLSQNWMLLLVFRHAFYWRGVGHLHRKQVEIGWDDILQEDSGKGIFYMELEDVEENADDGDGKIRNELSEGALSRQGLGGNLVADKLDSLMVITCKHLKSCANNGHLAKVFETLLQSFQMTLLNAYKSKFAQFVVFNACSLNPKDCGMKFATHLADIFECRTQPSLTRMSAVAYLASYLSRGKFLASSFVSSMLKRLIEWCFEYAKFWNGEETMLNPTVHQIFYSACQLQHMPLEPVLRHPLDPLKACLPSIVEEFLRQAKAARLFTISETFLFDNLLESDFSKAFGGMERLDMFFPFDPCLLKKCDRYIRPSFVFWSMVRTTYDDEEINIEDVDIDDGDFVNENVGSFRENGTAESIDDDDDDLDVIVFESSMNNMSITPKTSLKHRLPGQIDFPAQMPARIRPSTSLDW